MKNANLGDRARLEIKRPAMQLRRIEHVRGIAPQALLACGGDHDHAVIVNGKS